MTMYKCKLSAFGMVWCRVTMTSGPLRTARTAARAAGRSDLPDHSTACSDSTCKARGTCTTATCGGARAGGGQCTHQQALSSPRTRMH
jgi:hypothetical protein